MNFKWCKPKTRSETHLSYWHYKINRLVYLIVLLFALFSALYATTGDITTIAGTGTFGYNGDGIPATTAELYYPYYVAVDNSNNIYFSDSYNNRIREIMAGTNSITTVAGNGHKDTAATAGLQRLQNYMFQQACAWMPATIFILRIVKIIVCAKSMPRQV